MMKAAGSAAMREMDAYAINELKIPSTGLMLNAARHVADAAAELLPEGGSAAIFCGSGNNGGDGVAAAALLLARGYTVRAFLTGRREKLTPDTAEMEKRLIEAGGRLEQYEPGGESDEYTSGCDVIIDAMFGTGLNSDMRGVAAEAVKLINSARAIVVSADVPSGVSADTGEIMGSAVRADVTVTFTLPKPGLYIEPGCVCCGEVRVRDIGIPRELKKRAAAGAYTVEPEDISLPRRRRDSHKGDFGRDLILAGSVGYTGAPVMAARAASVSGAGLVYLGVPQDIYGIVAVKCDETMPFPLPSLDGKLRASAHEAVREKLETASAMLIGPGLGSSESCDNLIYKVLSESRIPVILDADGINAVSRNIDILRRCSCRIVLTPHLGEFSRLGGDISAGGRLAAAKRFAREYGVVLVLKGHRTITALPDGSAYINTTGGPALAKGGSGDVLAGMILSFIGQGFDVKDACLAAVCIHGMAGDICAERLGEYSVTAADVTGALPEVIKKLMR